MTPREVLLEAAKLVERGWTRGTAHRRRNGKDCYCAFGAINRAADGDYSMYAADELLRSYLRRVEKAPAHGTVSWWNDHKARSGKHVAKVMRAAAEKADR